MTEKTTIQAEADGGTAVDGAAAVTADDQRLIIADLIAALEPFDRFADENDGDTLSRGRHDAEEICTAWSGWGAGVVVRLGHFRAARRARRAALDVSTVKALVAGVWIDVPLDGESWGRFAIPAAERQIAEAAVKRIIKAHEALVAALTKAGSYVPDEKWHLSQEVDAALALAHGKK